MVLNTNRGDMDWLFQEIAKAQSPESAAEALEHLAEHFRNSGDFHRLFEARKYQARIRAGLPVYLTRPLDFRSSPAAAEVEQALLKGCREVGQLLAASGQLAAAWAYLQPIDDEAFIHQAIEAVPLDEAAISEVIQIALFERAHPVYGFGLLLQHLGSCQAISSYDAMAMGLSDLHRQQLAEHLIEHIHKELRANLLRGLENSTNNFTANLEDDGLSPLLQAESDRIRQSAPHLDATHLASAMRIALNVQSQQAIQRAVELAEYGRLLPDLLQYSGDPPFQNTYLDYGTYFRALATGEGDAAAKHFLAKAAAAEHPEQNLAALEIAVLLLFRTGHFDWALREALVAGPEFGCRGLAPNLIEIAAAAGDSNQALEAYRSSGDLLGYAAIAWARKFGDFKKNEARDVSSPGLF